MIELHTRAFFVSDAHLGAPSLGDDREREAQLIAFLEYASEQRGEIFVVGDLFEFWFEYRHAIPRSNFGVLATFYRLCRSGCRVHYLPGNHDLWIGSFLRDEVGLTVHNGPVAVVLGDWQAFVIHGDGMAAGDRGYRLLKKVLSHPVNIFLYRLLHPDFGIPFAKRMSQVSRAQGEQKADPFEQDYRRFALQHFERGYNIVIMGHTHRPLHEVYSGRHYLNIGDWIDHYSYIVLDEDGPRLLHWPEKRVYRQPKFMTEPSPVMAESATG